MTAAQAVLPRTGAAGPVVVGAVGGLAWAAGLRGLMAEVAGPGSEVSWGGTFLGVLLPGLVAGALLGRSEHRHRAGLRASRTVRGPALAGVAFAVVLAAVVVAGGLGGGALAIAVCGAAGGWALAGRGRVALRVAAGLLPVAMLVGWVVATPLMGPALSVTTPRGAWVAVLLASHLAVLCLAGTIPHRPVSASP